MSRDKDLQRILTSGIVAVVRFHDPEPLVDTLNALATGGITVAEVTLTVPQALEVIRVARQRLGERVLLGAGTVLDAEAAAAALLAGAEFIVAPTVNTEVIRLCHRYDKVVIPGAFTPTEILTAWEAGADIVKLFPANVVGPEFVRALRGPLPHIRLMPTGGIDLNNLSQYLAAGAACVGVGSQLVEPNAVTNRQWDRLTELARYYVHAVNTARQRLPKS
ncbi:MAG: bifunctional 4-hydroxy-2-oxoglutarate aldolase/2-dehydro-3-deoxy-phosphogluconate aldolase [Gemmataceae bacterium]|nr:bifunctional 4-hydroxy-2-oxoglutarate aldolase/2-dehydro-3-deoxy-phosphogluconate aldolase [Gemmataceae bacterium]MDW8242895.1 bifunctional 4-hydroxy-2-oxoglutarate aldolase/2-dehydro-3-deoxy-phosphogluconate aldolase [Thermogemmata sp.]